MKVFTPEISWHQKEPIFSVDFCSSTWRLATAGADFTVKIWQVKEDEEEGNIGIDFLANLDRHSKPVNVVRFSPDGQFLASAGDDCIIIIWKLAESDENRPQGSMSSDDVQNKESWTVHKMFRRGHLEDIYDVSWSPDGKEIISGSVDNSAIVWDVKTGQNTNILKDHKHYVQGVCWDPRGQYFVTYSSDRSCKIYSTSNHKCLYNIHKASLPMRDPSEEGPKSKTCKLFLDETMQSFFRRCSFSPDGSLLLLPGGVNEAGEKSIKTTYLFARAHLNKPALCLPGPNKASVASCFCPIVHELKDHSNDKGQDKPRQPLFKIPYRMSFAVATLDSILLYDTQHPYPFGMVSSVHYAPLTDLAWSSDGRVLVVSSLDGYCSFIRFEKGELGEPIKYDPIEYLANQAKAKHEAKKEREKKEEAKKEQIEAAKTPATPSQDKEKQLSSRTPTPARDQPTLHKFITPGGKRKRPTSQSSPSNQQASPVTPTQTKSPGTPKCTPVDGSPVIPKPKVKKTLSTSKLETIEESITEEVPATQAKTKTNDNLTPDLQATTKPPKRAKLLPLTSPLMSGEASQQFVTGSQTQPAQLPDKSANQLTVLMSSSAKAPRRIAFQTLSTLSGSSSVPAKISKPVKKGNVTEKGDNSINIKDSSDSDLASKTKDAIVLD